MEEQTRELLAVFGAGRIPKEIPEECEYAEELKQLSSYLGEVYRIALDISNGDLSATYPELKGSLAGSLKSLHANLRHLTWQTKQIAQGDLTHRIDFMGEFSEAFNSMVESLAKARADLLHLSIHDSLTGLHNRAYFDAELERVSLGRRFPTSIIMADLNGLKEVNDIRGHEAGDHLIKRAAALLRNSFRWDDIVARIGGDEFAVIMPSTPEGDAFAAIERIRLRLADIIADGEYPLSISLGAAAASAPEELKPAFKLADERMYQDKELHRDASFDGSHTRQARRRTEVYR